MEIALNKTLHVFDQVKKHLERIHKLDCPALGKAGEFARVHEQTKHVYEEFEAQWPSVDTAMIEDSLAAFKRGDYQLSEAFLDENGSCSGAN